MGQIKELAELEVYAKDLIILVIKEVKEHQGKPVDMIKDILSGMVTEKMKAEFIDAFSGLGLLPAELKEADVTAWIGFAINVVMSIPQVIEAISAPSTPAE